LRPLLRRNYPPAVDRVLCRVAEVLRGENEWMTDEVGAWLQCHRPTFRRSTLALQRRVVLQQALQLGVALDFDTVARLLESPGEVVNVSGDRFLRLDARGELAVVRPPVNMFNSARRVVVLDARRGVVSFGGLTIRIRIVPRRGRTRPDSLPCRERFDAEAVGKRILLRHWRAGDRFQPIGMKTAVKLQDLFTNAKVPVAERRTRVVAEAESGALFWVEGLRIGEGFKLTSSTRQQLDWAWKSA
jgi:tRNA(Ile)-lysidine synthase